MGIGGAPSNAGGKTTRGDDSEATLSYPPLPETESEVKAIAQFFGASPRPPDILLNVVANETQLRQAPLTRYRYPPLCHPCRFAREAPGDQ